MSFVTYVLLIAVSLGLSNRFRPEILGLTSSRALLIVGVELALIRLCTYLFNVQGDHYGILDLLSYSGYKFVPACVTLSVGVLGWGRLVWWSTYIYTHASLAFFLVSNEFGYSNEHLRSMDTDVVLSFAPPRLVSSDRSVTSSYRTRHRPHTRPLRQVWLLSHRDKEQGGSNCSLSSLCCSSSWAPGCASASLDREAGWPLCCPFVNGTARASIHNVFCLSETEPDL